VHWPAAIRAARAAVLLAPPADILVHQLKYRGWKGLAGALAERMSPLRLPDDAAAEAVLCVPVPTTAQRLRTRGYNQAGLIAGEYARRTRRRLAPLLERTTARDTQTHLQPAARAANVAGAFRVRPGADALLHGAHVLLIDDVLTTGATAGECAATLVAAGARCATVVTFARALDARRLTGT
jgi:ComF family protein